MDAAHGQGSEAMLPQGIGQAGCGSGNALCRFCTAGCGLGSSCTMSYSAVVAVGGGQGALEKALQGLESRGVLHCATAWCMRCHRVSVVACDPGSGNDERVRHYAGIVSWAKLRYPSADSGGGGRV